MKIVWNTESTRLVVKKFLSQALGMDEDDAEIDACKVEHLLSAEARSRLVSFLRFLLSQDDRSQGFLEAFRVAAKDHTLGCRDGDVDACLLCEDVCFDAPVVTAIAP